MSLKLATAFICALFIFSVKIGHAQNRTYYVDNTTGNDGNDGLSIAAAWKTIDKINTINFEPGDKVLFAGGQTFNGNIVITSEDAGIAANPIIFNSFGTGRAVINAGGGKGFLAVNVGGIEVRNLVVTGGVPASGTPNGVDFYIDDVAGGNIDYVKVDNVEVSNFEGAGIIISSDPTSSRGYSDVSISNVSSHDNKYAGLAISGKFTEFNHTNVAIRYSKFYNNLGNLLITSENTGNGIKLSSVDGLVIEYCEAYGNGINSNFSSAGPMGIYIYNTKNAVIQFCESHHNQTSTSHDGGGFSIDGGSINCILQYNYSHDNEGSGFAMYEFYNAPAFENNVIRYNVSQNDGRKNSYGALSFWGAATSQKIVNCEVYNNTFYLNNVGVLSGTPTAIDFIWNFFSGLKIRNNIFYTTAGTNMVSTDAGYDFTTAEVLFQNNNYFTVGSTNNFYWFNNYYSTFTAWSSASGQEMVGGQSTDPLLVNPGGHGTIGPASGGDLTTLSGYKLQTGSPIIDAGLNLSSLGVNTGDRDFYNNSIPYNTAFDIGAHEFRPLSVLPVSITSFTARKSDVKVHLSWRTENELNVKHYDVERSLDGIHFSSIGMISANQSLEYRFEDLIASSANLFYRLRIVDRNGRISYSIIIKVGSQASVAPTVFYGAGSGLQIRMYSEMEQWVTMNIYDASGRKVLSKSQKLYVGHNTILFKEVYNWQKGLYLIQLDDKHRSLVSFLK